jgi:CheY-like chemotaxis protein
MPLESRGSVLVYFFMLRILIADDNLIFRKALRHLLERVDFWQVIEASDGEEAVAKSLETRPDVIFLDLAMPGKDGFAAAQEISTLLPETPIIMCTMHMSLHVEAEARKHGIWRVISKTESSAMVPAIRQLLNRQEASPGQTLASDTISAPDLPVPSVSTANSTTATAPPGTESVSATPKNAA